MLDGVRQILVAPPAGRAGAAAKPGIDQSHVANLDARSVGAGGDDFADVFVAHRQRQFHAPVAELKPLAAAEVVIAVPDVQIAVADARGQDLQEGLAPDRFWRRTLHQLQRRPAFAHVVAFHRIVLSCANA